jgi:hypothetical protein
MKSFFLFLLVSNIVKKIDYFLIIMLEFHLIPYLFASANIMNEKK